MARRAPKPVVDEVLRFPTAVRREPAIDAWLGTVPAALAPLASTWFSRLRCCGDDVRELMHDGAATACVDDGAFAYVAAYRDHVNLGFFLGALLPDPAGLLEGTGKRGRHVKLWPGRPVDAAALDRLVDAAYRDLQRRNTR